MNSCLAVDSSHDEDPAVGAVPAPSLHHQRPSIQCPHLLRGWRFSRHAREQIDSRQFSPHAVVAACDEPEIRSTAFDYGPGRMRYARGDLLVIAVPESRLVVTALLRSYREWDDADARRIAGWSR